MLFFRKKKKKSFSDETNIVGAKARVSKDTELGKYCYVGNYSDITRAKIGNYVSIANNVSIGPGEHYLHHISTNSIFYNSAYAELTRGECTIGSDTWIGVNAVIRRGVSTGIGSVIGANSFVNKDVPDFGIVAGSPARLIAYRFPTEEQRLILASKWWELDLEHSKIALEHLDESLNHLRAKSRL